MNEFSKTKIGYSLALLAALFALSPLINSSTFSFALFSYDISIHLIYWIFVGLLALTVYLYAISLIKEENKLYGKFHTIGNYIYAFSLLFPPAIFLLFGISLITSLLPSNISENILEIIFMIITLIGIGLGTKSVALKMNDSDAKRKEEQSKWAEYVTLETAKKLIDTDMYDLAVIELWKTINLAFKRVLKSKAIPYDEKRPMEIIHAIHKNKLLPSEIINRLHELRDLRNKAAHTDINISKDEVQEYIKFVEKILAVIDNYTEECYYCKNSFPLDKMEVEEINGDYYACEDCAKEHPNWKDEILSMGMDS